MYKLKYIIGISYLGYILNIAAVLLATRMALFTGPGTRSRKHNEKIRNRGKHDLMTN